MNRAQVVVTAAVGVMVAIFVGAIFVGVVHAWEPTPRAKAALAWRPAGADTTSPRLAMGAQVLMGAGSRPEGATGGYWLTDAEVDAHHARSLDTYVTIGGATSVLAFTYTNLQGQQVPILVLGSDGGVYYHGEEVISGRLLIEALWAVVSERRAELCGETPR